MSEERRAILTNGNDPQVPYIIRLYESLRDPQRGNCADDFFVFTDDLSDRSLRNLEQFSIPVRLIKPEKIAQWRAAIPSDHPLGKVAKFWFLREASETLAREGYSKILYLDPDVLAQTPIESVLQAIEPNKLLMVPQIQPMTTLLGGPVVRILRAIRSNDLPPDSLVSFDYEINTGFIGSSPRFLERYANRYIDFVTSEKFKKYARNDAEGKHAWHDQDYLRAFLRIDGHDALKLQSKETIIHLCNGAHEKMRLRQGSALLEFRDTREAPIFLHFAGHSDVHFPFFIDYYDMRNIMSRRAVADLRLSTRAGSIKRLLRRARRVTGAILSEDRYRRLFDNGRTTTFVSDAGVHGDTSTIWDPPRRTYVDRGRLLRDVCHSHFGEKPIRVLQIGLDDASLMKSVLASDLYVAQYAALVPARSPENGNTSAASLSQTFNDLGQEIAVGPVDELLNRKPFFNLVLYTGSDSDAPTREELLGVLAAIPPHGILMIMDYGDYSHARTTKVVNEVLTRHAGRFRRVGSQIRTYKNAETGAPVLSSAIYLEGK